MCVTRMDGPKRHKRPGLTLDAAIERVASFGAEFGLTTEEQREGMFHAPTPSSSEIQAVQMVVERRIRYITRSPTHEKYH